jgi:hypothetical protein
MQIETSAEQEEKANSPRVATLATLSNVTTESPVQRTKQCSEIAVTDEGMEIDLSEKQPSNADRPRIETTEPLSNATTDRRLQS